MRPKAHASRDSATGNSFWQTVAMALRGSNGWLCLSNSANKKNGASKTDRGPDWQKCQVVRMEHRASVPGDNIPHPHHFSLEVSNYLLTLVPFSSRFRESRNAGTAKDCVNVRLHTQEPRIPRQPYRSYQKPFPTMRRKTNGSQAGDQWPLGTEFLQTQQELWSSPGLGRNAPTLGMGPNNDAILKEL